jgi:hypothetical protein
MVQRRYGRFVVNRYYGIFGTLKLQARADTGSWFAYAMGTGLDIEGEGETPELAIADMKHRAKAMADEIIRVYL